MDKMAPGIPGLRGLKDFARDLGQGDSSREFGIPWRRRRRMTPAGILSSSGEEKRRRVRSAGKARRTGCVLSS